MWVPGKFGLVVTARVWPTEGLAHSEDASTSMSELRPKEGEARPKPAALSFRDERARLEWPKRRTPPGRRVKEGPKRDESGAEEGEDWREQASWGECS